MKLLTIKFIFVFVYLISTNVAYAIKQPNIKNLLVYDKPKKVENITFLKTISTVCLETPLSIA